MTDTSTEMMELNGPAADRKGDRELDLISDFHFVTLSHSPGRLVATIRAPESPGEADDREDCILYLNRIGFLKIPNETSAQHAAT